MEDTEKRLGSGSYPWTVSEKSNGTGEASIRNWEVVARKGGQEKRYPGYAEAGKTVRTAISVKYCWVATQN